MVKKAEKKAERNGLLSQLNELPQQEQNESLPEKSDVQVETREQEEQAVEEFPFAAELNMLQEMGFSDLPKISEMLVKHLGRLDSLLSELLA